MTTATPAWVPQRARPDSGAADLRGIRSLPGGRLPARVVGLARRHRAFTVVFVLGLTLRVLATIAYRPAFEFWGDSFVYLQRAAALRPAGDRPFGYSALLVLLRPVGWLGVVPLVQHLVGLALGVALYAFLRHRGLPAWLGVLGAAPVLLDAYQVDIEQFVLAETMVDALLVGALLALLWRRVPSRLACGLAGAALALAVLTRTAALGVAVTVGLYLLLRRVGWRRVGVFAAAFVVPLLGYAGWFAATNGSYALSNSSGAFLYARVGQIAKCSAIHATAAQQILCSPHPPSQRPGPNYYMWDKHSPRNRLPVPKNDRDAVLADFAHKVILAQPLDYASMASGDVVHYFAPGRWTGARDWPDGSWRFPNGSEQEDWHVSRPLKGFSGEPLRWHRVGGLATVLRGYQRQGFTPGPLLGAALLLALVAAARRGGSRVLRADCLLLAAGGLTLLVVPSATACFDYRYLLPTLVLLPPAGVLAVHQLRLRRAPTAPPPETRAPTAPADRAREVPPLPTQVVPARRNPAARLLRRPG